MAIMSWTEKKTPEEKMFLVLPRKHIFFGIEQIEKQSNTVLNLFFYSSLLAKITTYLDKKEKAVAENL